MANPDPRFSSASIISPHSALEALAAREGIDPHDLAPGDDTTTPSSQSAAHPANSLQPSGSHGKRPESSLSSSSHTSTSTNPHSNPHQSSNPSSASHTSVGRSTPLGNAIALGPTAALPTPPAEPQRVWVRAKYDFRATDPSALSFTAGEVIEVYTKLESGWWDGMLGATRGWFPSNFVEPYEAREFEGEAFGRAQESGEQSGEEEEEREGGMHEEEDEDDRPIEQSGVRQSTGNLGWGDAVGKGGWGGGEDLDDLARQVMQGAGIDDEVDEEDDFGAVAAERRRRQQQADDEAMEATIGAGRGGGFGMIGADVADEMGPDEFGVAPRRRQREETERTLTLTRGPVDASTPTRQRDAESHSRRTSGTESVVEKHGEGGERHEESAWVPTLTDDGQVYYHNTVTGEDSWHLPESALAQDDKEIYDEDEEDDNKLFTSITASSSGAFGAASQMALQTPDRDEDNFASPAHRKELPVHWVAKLSDDGRSWYYLNRITGQTQKETPEDEYRDDMDKASMVSSNFLNTNGGPPTARHSVEVRRRIVEDWSKATRVALEGLMVPPSPKIMSWHMETVQNALHKVVDAASLGISTEEDLARAQDLGSAGGVESASRQQEDAVQTLKEAYANFTKAMQTLYKAYGWTGQDVNNPEAPRPKWQQDLTIVAAMGKLSGAVHAATESKYLVKDSNSVWSEVIKMGGRMRDVLGSFPDRVSPDKGRLEQDQKLAAKHQLVLETDGAGQILGGRWGFGDLPTTEDEHLQVLDHGVVVNLKRLKDDYEALEYGEETVLQLIRLATQFKAALLKVDIAEVVDVDGDMSNATREEDTKAYRHLVASVLNTLMDLEESTEFIDPLAMELLKKFGAAPDVFGALRVALDGGFSSMERLLQLATQQKALAVRANLMAQIGHRSPRFDGTRPETRPISMISNLSRLSKVSDTRGADAEEEFLDEDDERRDQAGDLVSASTNASQSSLIQQQQHRQAQRDQRERENRVRHGSQGDISAISATSSTTSLGYQQAESDGGSLRSKRTSLMKFMKGRGSTDDDGRGTLKSKGPSKKLAKILGEDYALSQASPGSQFSVPPPTQALPTFVTPPETPWYLGDDYPPADIVIDSKGEVRAGTLTALVARLTPHGSTDTAFFQAFMLTFRSFTTGPELVELLFDRYMLEAPHSLDERQYNEWKKMKQTPIRLRVSNVLRSWLDVHYLEAEDASVLDQIEDFASTTMASEGSELLSRQLVALVQRRRLGEGEVQKRIISGGLLSPPAPLVPKTDNGRVRKVTDISPVEMARQLTIIEFQHFQNITMNECLNKRWTRSDCMDVAPNLRGIIKMANVVAGFVTTNILGQKDVKARAGMVKYFIQTSQELRNLNNFSSMASVMAGVNSAPITRLKRTNEFVAPKYWTMKAGLDKMLDSTKNFSNYKDMLKTINPPCVPFFGFWLSALTFIEDGNKDIYKPPAKKPNPNLPGEPNDPSNTSAPASAAGTPARTPLTASTSSSALTTSTSLTSSTSTPLTSSAPASAPEVPSQPLPQASGPLINFFKRSLTAEILRDIQQYQSQPYNLARCKVVYEYVMFRFEGLKKDLPSMDRLYDMSLELEPREREEERITRMLHDSNMRNTSGTLSLMR